MTDPDPELVHRSMLTLLEDARRRGIEVIMTAYGMSVMRWRIKVLKKQEKS